MRLSDLTMRTVLERDVPEEGKIQFMEDFRSRLLDMNAPKSLISELFEAADLALNPSAINIDMTFRSRDPGAFPFRIWPFSDQIAVLYLFTLNELIKRHSQKVWRGVNRVLEIYLEFPAEVIKKAIIVLNTGLRPKSYTNIIEAAEQYIRDDSSGISENDFWQAAVMHNCFDSRITSLPRETIMDLLATKRYQLKDCIYQPGQEQRIYSLVIKNDPDITTYLYLFQLANRP